MKETYVDALKPGQPVDDIFVVRDKQLSHKKNGEPFLTFQLIDRTGAVKAVVWDHVEETDRILAEAEFIQVSGRVNTQVENTLAMNK